MASVRRYTNLCVKRQSAASCCTRLESACRALLEGIPGAFNSSFVEAHEVAVEQ